MPLLSRIMSPRPRKLPARIFWRLPDIASIAVSTTARPILLLSVEQARIRSSAENPHGGDFRTDPELNRPTLLCAIRDAGILDVEW